MIKNAALLEHTCFNVGGPADILAMPENRSELSDALRARQGMPVTILGGCSNVLIGDSGIRGMVIIMNKLKGEPELAGDKIKCMAGTPSVLLSHFAADRGLAGLEFLSGIPGTIGGAICGNAGAYGQAVSDTLVEIEAMDYDGNIRIIPAKQLEFSYRKSNVPKNSIIVSGTFALAPGDALEIKNKMKSYREQRMAKQPAGVRTCGSLFKNPPNDFAARLIESAGWKGREMNGAAISDKHANFLTNLGTASAADLRNLADAVRQDIKSKFGIELEYEIKFIGY